MNGSGARRPGKGGPFAESNELIDGHAILQAKSKEEAIQLGKDFMKLHLDIPGPSYEAELEIRQMFDSMDCAGKARSSEVCAPGREFEPKAGSEINLIIT